MKTVFKFTVAMDVEKKTIIQTIFIFCSIEFSGYNIKKKKIMVYANFTSAYRTIGYELEVSMPVPSECVRFTI